MPTPPQTGTPRNGQTHPPWPRSIKPQKQTIVKQKKHGGFHNASQTKSKPNTNVCFGRHEINFNSAKYVKVLRALMCSVIPEALELFLAVGYVLILINLSL